MFAALIVSLVAVVTLQNESIVFPPDKDLCDGWQIVDGIVLDASSTEASIKSAAQKAGWSVENLYPSKYFGCIEAQLDATEAGSVRLYFYGETKCLKQLRALHKDLLVKMKKAGKHKVSKASGGRTFNYVSQAKCDTMEYGLWYTSPVESYDLDGKKRYGFYCGYVSE